MLSYWLLFLVLVAAAVSPTHSSAFCSNVTSVPNLDVTQLQGEWTVAELAEYKNGLPTGRPPQTNCFGFNIVHVTDTELRMILQVPGNNSVSNEKIKVTRDEEGRVTFGNSDPEAPDENGYIVAADANKHFVLVTCSRVQKNGVEEILMEIMVLSRRAPLYHNLTPEEETELNKRIASALGLSNFQPPALQVNCLNN